MNPGEVVTFLTQMRDALAGWRVMHAKQQHDEILFAATNRRPVPKAEIAEYRKFITHHLDKTTRLLGAVALHPRAVAVGVTGIRLDVFENLFTDHFETVCQVAIDLVNRAIGIYAERERAEQAPSPREGSSMPIRIFVSHAAKDVALAKAFVTWLEGCLEAPAGSIRCTSVPGYKLEVGDDPAAVLAANLAACSTVIALVTDASLESAYVFAELGAGWALKKRVCSLFMPSVDFGRLRGPIANRHAIKLDETPDLAQFAESLAGTTGLAPKNAGQRSVATDEFVEKVAAAEKVIAEQAARVAVVAAPRRAPITSEKDAIILLREWAFKNAGTHHFDDVDQALNLQPGLTVKLVSQLATATT